MIWTPYMFVDVLNHFRIVSMQDDTRNEHKDVASPVFYNNRNRRFWRGDLRLILFLFLRPCWPCKACIVARYHDSAQLVVPSWRLSPVSHSNTRMLSRCFLLRSLDCQHHSCFESLLVGLYWSCCFGACRRCRHNGIWYLWWHFYDFVLNETLLHIVCTYAPNPNRILAYTSFVLSA